MTWLRRMWAWLVEPSLCTVVTRTYRDGAWETQHSRCAYGVEWTPRRAALASSDLLAIVETSHVVHG